MTSIKVFGHKPADTDSTCSPIVYAWYLSEKKGAPATAFITSDLNKESAFALKKLGISTPEKLDSVGAGDQIVIIDSTNPEELIADPEKADVLEVIDHHKLSGLKTSTPLKATIRPTGCSATVICGVMKSGGFNDLPKEMASLLITAILSDTLNLTSPTTTDEDKQALEELNKIANLDINTYASELFEAKSDLSGMSAKDVLMADAKEFDLAGKKVLVGVHETTNPQNALALKKELINEINAIKTEKKYEGVFFFIIDILNAYAETILASDYEKGIVEKAFNTTSSDSQARLPGIVSRKKQIVPALEKAL